MMGDEFDTNSPPRLRIRATGTKPIARGVVVKDNNVVHIETPNAARADFSWLDGSAKAGTSYYYVRVEQEDGQIAWASPMWIRYRP